MSVKHLPTARAKGFSGCCEKKNTFRRKKRFIISSSFRFGNPKMDGAEHNLFGGSNPNSSGNGTTSQKLAGMQCFATKSVQYCGFRSASLRNPTSCPKLSTPCVLADRRTRESANAGHCQLEPLTPTWSNSLASTIPLRVWDSSNVEQKAPSRCNFLSHCVATSPHDFSFVFALCNVSEPEYGC